jgi:DNA-binding winged helix-turn-helix (wHTH) protein/Tol biopolymer transport system component
MNSLSENRRVGFGDFVLDLESRVLTRNGAVVRLPAKVIDTLVALVMARGEVVSKESLLAQVWPTTIVEESGLQRNISLLRKEFQNFGAEDLIETVPKRGYRFTGQLHDPRPLSAEAVAEETLSAAGDDTGVRRKRRWISGLAAGTVGALGLGLYLARGPESAPVSAPQAAAVEAKTEAPPPAELQAKLTQITSNASELPVTAAAISPDGKWLAYDERASLRLRNVATGEVSELKSPPAVQTAFLTWSASGDDVLISGLNLDTRVSELWRVPRSGAQPSKLVHDALMAAASPVGDRLAFLRGQYELWTTAADGTSAELFLQAPGDRRMMLRPAFSRDGKRLYMLLYGNTDPIMHLDVYDVQTRKLVFRAPTGLIQDFALLDDDTMLVALLKAGSYQRGVYLATLSLDFDRQSVVETHRMPEWPYYRAYELSATADGRTASFVRDQTQSDIYVGNLGADNISLSGVRRLTLDDGADRLSGWLPDSRTVLFHAVRDQVGIYRQEVDAVRATPLADDSRPTLVPTSTQDGRWLLYMALAPGGTPSAERPSSLMRKSLVDATPAQSLLATPDPYAAAICARRAPRCIFGAGTDGKTTFSEIDVEKGTLKQLFSLPFRFELGFNWAVSPDGRSLAYVERASGGMRIAIRDLDSLGSMRASLPVEGNGMLRSVVWDADGQGVFAMQCFGEPGLLLHIDMKARARVVNTGYSGCDCWAVPSPDGRRLAFVQWTSTANLWMLTR